MKRKFLSVEFFKNLIKPNEELSFTEISQIPGITMPKEKAQFMVYHGTIPIIGVTSVVGTTYVCRIDPKDEKPLNWDVHQVWVGKTESLELKGIKTDFHHSTHLPEFIRKDAPPEIIEKVRSAILSIEQGKPSSQPS